jgi:hypothetical protein
VSILPKKIRPHSKKIVLTELSIGVRQSFWVNYSAYVYYVDFDAIYSDIEASLLNGVSAQSIVSVGGVSADTARCVSVTTVPEVQATELTFLWDPVTRRVYVHLQGGDEPSLHDVVLGVTYGISNHAGKWNGVRYMPRLKAAPAVRKSKDPLFYGKVGSDGGTISVSNEPDPGETVGPFDTIGEENYVFGSNVRSLMGFDDDVYADFTQFFSGVVGDIFVGADLMTIEAVDGRSDLTLRLPELTFTKAEYPNLADGNVGVGLSIGYGPLRSVPVVCTNEAVSPTPSYYTFKLFDTTHHAGIHAINTVRVDGAVKIPSATDLVNATFTLTPANYTPGQTVTCDCEGYVDGAGDLISNSVDVIRDLMTTWHGLLFDDVTFNTLMWNAAAAQAPIVGLFNQDPVEIIELIEQCCSSAGVDVLQQDDGRFTAKYMDPDAAPSMTLTQDQLLGPSPVIRYDRTQVLTSTLVGYAKDWQEDRYQRLHDTSQSEEIYEKFGKRLERTFDTLLTSEADAQVFSDRILLLSGDVRRTFSITTKLQTMGVDVGDTIQVPIRRPSGRGLLGDVVAYVLGVEKDFMGAKITLDCMILRVVPNTYYVQGRWWGYRWWGYQWWRRTQRQAAA